MRPVDIVCRTCRKTYNLTEGCAICESAKRNIIWPDPTTQGSEMLSASRQALRLTQSLLDRLDRAMNEGSLGARKGEFNIDWADQCTKLNRGLASLLDATRKLEDNERKRVESGSFEEQIEIWLDWVGQLPREKQEALLGSVVNLLEAPAEAEIVL